MKNAFKMSSAKVIFDIILILYLPSYGVGTQYIESFIVQFSCMTHAHIYII